MPAKLRTRVQSDLAPKTPTANLRATLTGLITRRNQRVLLELPDFMFALALTLRNGLSLYAALNWLAPRLGGVIGNEIRRLVTDCEFGAEFRAELTALSDRLAEPQLSELVSKLTLASDRGTPVAQLVEMQAESVQSEINQLLLRRAGQNETKMLVPTVFLILPTTVLFAVFPSLQLLFAGLI